MDDAVLLNELKTQGRIFPFQQFKGHLPALDTWWIGRTTALLARWEPGPIQVEVGKFRGSAEQLHMPLLWNGAVNRMRTILFEAVNDLEIRLANRPATGGVFPPNSQYDFFQTFKETVVLAKTDLLIVDPFLDDGIFPYLTQVDPGSSVRLLMHRADLIPIVQKARTAFESQFKRKIDLRDSNQIHDRVVFFDRNRCYLIGASIKDAAARKPTFFVPLSDDLVALKLSIYEAIWNAATPI